MHEILQLPERICLPTKEFCSEAIFASALEPAMKSRTSEPTIFVVDADEFQARAVCTLAKAHKFKVVAFSSAEEFWNVLSHEHCGCIVIEVDLPGMSGMMLQDRMLQHGISLPIVMLAAEADVTVAVQAMRNGAVDFLQKPWHPLKLWEAIQLALQRDSILRIDKAMHADVQTRLASLRGDEHRVMDLLLQGSSKRSIAKQLDVSVRTLDFRRASILRKMRVKSLLELAQLLAQFKDRPRPHVQFRNKHSE